MEDTIDVIPLNPSIGAEVVGVDLPRATQSQIEDIKSAFSRHKLLVFRDQSLNAEEHKAFARHFGPLHIHPRYSHLGAEGDPQLFIINTHADSKYSNGEAWHSDVSCDPVPPMASLLYVEQPPPDGGGDTLVSFSLLLIRYTFYVFFILISSGKTLKNRGCCENKEHWEIPEVDIDDMDDDDEEDIVY